MRALYARDLAGLLHTPAQPMLRMTHRYDELAQRVVRGEGLLRPRLPHDPADTSLLSRPPGYPLFLSLVYHACGRDFFAVQFWQDLFDATTPVLVFLLAGALVAWRVALLAGLLAAIWHSLAFDSNLVLPDAPSVVPLLLGLWLLARDRRRPGFGKGAAAGACFGLAAWLRPNAVILAPSLAVALLLVAPRRRAWPAAAGLLAGAAALVAPITLRNYVVYHRFVPLSTNLGIVMWRGIAEAGGERFGARATESEVAQQEAAEYADPRYALWWASPDGIDRDRARVRKSLAVIRAHPAWFARSVAARAAALLDFAGPTAPLLAEAAAAPSRGTGWLAPGAGFEWARRPLRAAQWLARAALLPLFLLGLALLGALGWRRALLPAAALFSFLGFQSLMHLEERMALPLEAIAIVFGACGLAGLASLARLRTRRAGR